ncbi:hypothetical protein QE152_g38785 [Popillia japonica]|uniref:XRE family transcriptional regulator n=1 Tax=Popillia japonica TaxID=7064 RepID=A0AAW1HVV4_POPJA
MAEVEKGKLVKYLFRRGVNAKEIVQLTEFGKSSMWRNMSYGSVSGTPSKIIGNNLIALVTLGRQNPHQWFRKLANLYKGNEK